MLTYFGDSQIVSLLQYGGFMRNASLYILVYIFTLLNTMLLMCPDEMMLTYPGDGQTVSPSRYG